MGRRKIEIRPIKDDRNRSVTFLKRKGGLFKKAYELSVLCSVDVAVIIFGNNKKLYEFSSGDIHETVGRFQYYGSAHEHKGPADFAGKAGGDEEEEEEDAAVDHHESHSPPEPQQMMQQQQQQQQQQHHLQNQPGLQHMRHATPSASPPIPNGVIPPFPQRMSTPQPPNASRPSSRMSLFRRTSSNLVPQQHMGTPSQAPAPPPNYVYSPNPSYHPPPPAAVMQRPPPQPFAVQAPQYHPAYPPPTQQQMHQAQQAYLQQEHRRQSSLPPGFMGQVHPGAQQHIQPPPQPYPQHQTHSAQPSPQPDHGSFQSPPLPQPRPMPAHNRSHSIFTPIDDKRSLLAQHWGGSSSSKHPAIKTEGPRSQSVDVAVVSRDRAHAGSPTSFDTAPPPPTSRPMQMQYPAPPQRTASTSSMPGPPRPGAAQSETKRPRLKVQIPSEQSDAGSATSDSSPKDTGTTAGVTPMRVGQGVVLPPPSPSTNNVLSAGASGPPNPFARPAPPISTNPHVNREREHIETPLSALPSRVMDGNQMLPSPSSFWPDAWFGRDNNMMPSPLNFQTPVVMNGPSFRDEDAEKKRKAEEEGGGGGKRGKDQ